MRSLLCLCIPLCQRIFWIDIYETWYVYHGTWAHLNGIHHTSLPSVCFCICIPPILATQWLGKHVPAATIIRNNRRIVERVFFYTVHVLSKEIRRIVLLRTSCIFNYWYWCISPLSSRLNLRKNLFHNIWTSSWAQVSTFLTSVQFVPVSNLGRDTDHPKAVRSFLIYSK
jgi:hypothetical protein